MESFLLYVHTARHLRLRQIFFRGYYFARKRFAAVGLPPISEAPKTRQLQITQPIPRPCSCGGTTFTFLNRTYEFKNQTDWNFSGHGKLWCYNLNYFDFLNQEGAPRVEGLNLIRDFIDRTDTCSVGLEPYPTSLRIINWIKFVSTHDVRDRKIDTSLCVQSQHLCRNLEYHLLGNHLLENGFALLFAGSYCNDDALLATARTILRDQLNEQILPDGAHFELSPMYHQIILDRLLDCVNLLQSNGGDPLLPLLTDKAALMLGWLGQMTFRDGSIPLLNDAAAGVAPESAEILAYAQRLRLAERIVPFKESGYRKISHQRYELVMDVGSIGPDYLPGHAHSDTLNFVLHLDGVPLIVDTGTSTYETNEQRLLERGTAAHNTVVIDGLEQSEVWGSFRVARRAKVRDLMVTECSISAWHDGYLRIGARHRRTFLTDESFVEIVDQVTRRKPQAATAFLHFHPDVDVQLDGAIVLAGSAVISFAGSTGLTLKDYQFAPEFNRYTPAKVVEIAFDDSLTTRIEMYS